MFSVIIATSKVFQRNGKNMYGIGKNNKLPWNSTEDMKHFKQITCENSEGNENIVIMGRNTYESIGKPLKNRINIVITSKQIDNVICVNSFIKALMTAYNIKRRRYIFVIGGKKVYEEALTHPNLESIYHTIIDYEGQDCDVCIDEDFLNVKGFTKKNLLYDDTQNYYYKYERNIRNTYHDLLEYILYHGEERQDRTETGTISVFCPDNLVFDLTYKFPLITTKFVPLRIVFEELMWFLRGQTDNKILQSKSVHIWDGNSSKEYMEKIGLKDKYPDGELGPVYSAQWRNFGGKHILTEKNHIASPETNGFDQIKFVIEELKTNPFSRRILVSAYNPLVLKEIALPSCHYTFQFYVRKGDYLDCKMCMRSTDVFLGLPFNIASYSLLTMMIANMTGYKPGKLYISFGDAHIYKNHIEQVKLQLSRTNREFPVVEIIKTPEHIEDWEFDMFNVVGYNPHPIIKGDMSV